MITRIGTRGQHPIREDNLKQRIQIPARIVLLAFLLGVGLTAAPALADQIFIQQSGTSPAGGDPNLITDPGAFVTGVAGNATGQNPLLIIVGVYDGNGTPTISFAGGVSAATIGTYGLTADTATFTTGDADVALGLSVETESESFTNWSAGDIAAGFAAPSSFTLYAFALDTTLSGTITIGESGATNGSFIVAYDCKDGTGSSSGCAKKGDIMDTPFTNAGLLAASTAPVPEPTSLLLFGAGLLALLGAKLRYGL